MRVKDRQGEREGEREKDVREHHADFPTSEPSYTSNYHRIQVPLGTAQAGHRCQGTQGRPHRLRHWELSPVGH